MSALANKEKIIYTIGHSNRSLEEFLQLLLAFNIELLVDIRRLPGSRKYPHFDKEQLSGTLPAHGIDYIHLEALGGRRKSSALPVNPAWRNASFGAYAAYMETKEFEDAIADLQKTALQLRVAYMCSEAVWWSCHRALVSDFLKLRGWKVLHIMTPKSAKEHPWTSPAVIENGRLVYKSKQDPASGS